MNQMPGPLSKKRMSVKKTLPISALIVGYNEADLLEDCLTSISFCDEILYIDLGSSDDSLNLAIRYGASPRRHVLVPSGEHAVADFYFEARHEWILFIDPDEQIDSILELDLRRAFLKHKTNPEVGVFSAPWQFYFKGKKLIGTPWGGRRPRMFLAHRDRFSFIPETHRGRILQSGFREILLRSEGSIHHYWSDSWASLVKKHIRYLKTEGGSRYRRGDRISIWGALTATPKIFADTFSKKLDRKDGLRGIGLNLLWSVYKSQALMNLAFYCLWAKFFQAETHRL